jgi:hypothetical protein
MTHPSEIAKAREAQATAMLLEYKDKAWTKQQILIPAVKVGDEWTRPMMAQRWIANHSPRKQWRIYRGPSAPAELDLDTVDGSMDYASRTLNYFAMYKHFEQAIATGSVRAVPIVLADLTEADAFEAKEGRAPSALLRRIQRARLEAGYPEHAYDWPEAATTTTTTVPASAGTYISLGI